MNRYARILRLALGLLTAFFLSVGFLPAQDFRALIIGQVTDKSGAVVPGATVTAVKTDSGQIRNTYEPQLSVALQKQFAMTESKRLQFRIEAFNVTNTAIFPGPDLDFHKKPTLQSNSIWTGFGTVPLEQQNFPRNIQVALKVPF